MTDESDKGKLPFGALVMDYEQACDALKAAETAHNIARNAATTARNRVNDLQKQIAARCGEMQKKAPYGTDWADAGRKVEPA